MWGGEQQASSWAEKAGQPQFSEPGSWKNTSLLLVKTHPSPKITVCL